MARSGVRQHSRRLTGRASHPRTVQPDRWGKVSMFADGVGTVDANGSLQLRQNVTLKSNSPAHAWVNSIAVRGSGRPTWPPEMFGLRDTSPSQRSLGRPGLAGPRFLRLSIPLELRIEPNRLKCIMNNYERFLGSF